MKIVTFFSSLDEFILGEIKFVKNQLILLL